MKKFGKKRGYTRGNSPSRQIIPRLLEKLTDYPLEPLSITHSHAPPIDYPQSYINQLPLELLQQIFLLVVNDINYHSIFSVEGTTISANVTSPPIVFTRVCCHWRVVAQSTPEIWSRIEVMLPEQARSAEPGPLKPFLPSLLQAWLSRSGNQPLTLRIVSNWQSRQDHFTSHLNWGSRFSEAALQLFRILLSESLRWETVLLMIPTRDWGSNFNTPQLRSLRCCLPDFRRFDAPNLSRLCTCIMHLGDIQFNHTPTCNNIRHLHIPTASANAVQRILGMFPHLKTIVVDTFLQEHSRMSNPVTNSCLELMALPSEYHHFQTLIKVFNGLRLPKLQKLVMMGQLNQAEVARIRTVLAVQVAARNAQVVDLHTPLLSSATDATTLEYLGIGLDCSRHMAVNERAGTTHVCGRGFGI